MTSAPSRSDGQPLLRVESAGTTRTYDVDRVVIGREADCDVVVSEPSASRHHAVLQREGNGWVAVDTSSNGTFVRGQRITRMPVGVNPLSLHLGGPVGEAVVVSLVACPLPGAASGAAVPTSPPPYEPSPAAPDSEWWRNLPPPQLPAVGGAGGRLAAAGRGPARSVGTRPLGRAAATGRGRQRPHDRAWSGQRRRARGRAGQPAPRAAPPGRPGTGGCPAGPGQLQRHVRQRAPGRGIGAARGRCRGDLRQPDVPLGRHPAAGVGDDARVHLVRRRPHHRVAGRQAAAPERVVQAQAVQPDRRDRAFGRRQVDAAPGPHRAPAGHARSGDLAGPRPLRALRPAPVPDRPGPAAGHPAPAAQGAPGAPASPPSSGSRPTPPGRSRTRGSIRWPTSCS